MISEENLIRLSSVRDRWITEIRSANIPTDANPGTTIPQSPIVAALDPELHRAGGSTALEARLSSDLIKADADNKMESHRLRQHKSTDGGDGSYVLHRKTR